MSRRTCTLALMLVLALSLAACASSGPGLRTDSDTARRSPSYLRGVSGESSIRIDQVRGSDLLGEDSSMREGLIAGDATIHVAAAMFRCGEFYTLDLIVLNHTDRPMVVHHGDFTVVDHNGRWLTPVSDWNGASEVGLRTKMKARKEPLFAASGSLGGNEVAGGSASAYNLSSAAGTKSPADRPGTGAPRASGMGTDPISNLSSEVRVPNAPATIHVDGNSGRSYWAYWRADEVAYPLTAFMMLDNRHIVFLFDR